MTIPDYDAAWDAWLPEHGDHDGFLHYPGQAVVECAGCGEIIPVPALEEVAADG